jgi:hypothetical protein
MLDSVRARVFMASGAALATTLANCAHVLICRLLPVVLASLRSPAMHSFRRQSHVADIVGMLVGLVVAPGVGALVGIVVNVLIVLMITLLMAGNGTLFPGNGTLFPIL